MREYEAVFILKGNTEGAAADKIQDKVRELVARHKETLLGIRYLGKKNLSYRIEKEVRGNYYQVNWIGKGAAVPEVERFFRMSEDVIRFLTVKLSDDVDPEKRTEEYKKGPVLVPDPEKGGGYEQHVNV